MALLGIAGGILLVIAWLLEMIDSIKKHKGLVDLKFAGIYFFGSLLLAIYAYQINDVVYLSLGIVLTSLVFFEIIYTVYAKKMKKR